MKFGPVPLGETEGAILAHSVALTDGKRLRKGRVLTAQDVIDMGRSGLTDVTVARLEAGDIGENAAAGALADAFAPTPSDQGLECTKPFTGRVNLLAVGPGVVQMDANAIAAVNQVHPMITIATVPAFQQMRPGGMVATIKIISYAVPKADLDRACALAKGALRMLSAAVSTVDLIVTEIDGGAGDKGWPAIAGRVAAFDIDMATPVMVAHRVEALAKALQDSTADLTLILTGSATSDVSDVAPEALRQAGGAVHRFGMPVDPGNLLFIGELSGRPVIGLPGCARSPALNGADWVMSRVICGIPVSDADISSMGVGGLLKEIPTRPQPRSTRKS